MGGAFGGVRWGRVVWVDVEEVMRGLGRKMLTLYTEHIFVDIRVLEQRSHGLVSGQ
jgi:hypothetical protein